MRFTSGFLAAIAVLILAALAVSYSGVVNVAATEPDNPVSGWFLSNTMQRSVRQQASGIAAPRQASEDEVREGFRFYSDACVYCHGAPGKDPTDIGKGLNPEPPYLPDVAARWSSAELFWIAKNGHQDDRHAGVRLDPQRRGDLESCRLCPMPLDGDRG